MHDNGSMHLKVLPALVLGLSVAGCSLFRPAPVPPPPAPAPPPPKPVLPTPTATHRFDIDAETQVVGYVQRTTIGKEDTFSDIARRFDVGYQEVVLANPGVDPWLPGVGREVVVPTEFVLPAAPHQGIVVNVAAMRLFYFPPHKKDEQQVVYTYPIGIGREGWKTREGTTTVISHTKNPVWVVPRSVREEHARDGDKLPAEVPPGPDNPLGQYRLRLGWPTYLIHGTNKPYGVGMRVSHGCMHLYPEDIAELFNLVPIGTKVTIVNQPYVFGWKADTLYLQAYAVMEDDNRDWAKHRENLLAPVLDAKARQQITEQSEWANIDELAQAPRGVPSPLVEGAKGVDAVVAQALLVENTLPQGSNWQGETESSGDQPAQDLMGKQISE
jgi:L,D-transpeptidase ErfK/SrfK